MRPSRTLVLILSAGACFLIAALIMSMYGCSAGYKNKPTDPAGLVWATPGHPVVNGVQH